MPRSTNLLYFFIFIIPGIIFQSCKKEEYKSPIPYVYVNFSLRMDDPEFAALNAVGNSVLVTSALAGEYSAGYDYNGIIVYRASTEDFYAFDATCPHDIDSASVAVGIDGGSTATCPACHSKYILFNNGFPSQDGPSVSALKAYITEFDNDKTISVHSW